MRWLLLLLLLAAPVHATDWWNSTWNYRFPVNITNTVYERNDTPVSVTANFTSLIASSRWVFDDNSVRVIEYNSTGQAIPYNSTATDLFQYEVPSQFDKVGGFDNGTNAQGTVHWIMNGTLTENATRYYYVYFDVNDSHASTAYQTDLNWTLTTFRNDKIEANFTNASLTSLSYLALPGNWSDALVVNFTSGYINRSIEANCTMSGGAVRQVYDCRVNDYEVLYTFYSLASFFEFQVNGTNAEAYDIELYTTIPDSSHYSNRLARYDTNYTENYTFEANVGPVYSFNGTVTKGWLAWYDTTLSAVAYCLWNFSLTNQTRLAWENLGAYNRTVLSIGSNDTEAHNISAHTNITLTIGFEPGGEHSRADLAYTRLFTSPHSLASGAIETNTLLDLIFTPSYAYNGSNINITMYLTGGRNVTDLVFFNISSPNSTTWLMNSSFTLFGNSAGNTSLIFNDTRPAGVYTVFAYLETDRGTNRTETFTLCRALNTSWVELDKATFQVGLGDFFKVDMTIPNSSLLCSNALGSGSLRIYVAGDTIARGAEFLESGASTIYVSTPTSAASKEIRLLVRGAVIGIRTLTVYVAEAGIDPWFTTPITITVSQNVHGMDVTPGLSWLHLFALLALATFCLSGRALPENR